MSSQSPLYIYSSRRMECWSKRSDDLCEKKTEWLRTNLTFLRSSIRICTCGASNALNKSVLERETILRGKGVFLNHMPMSGYLAHTSLNARQSKWETTNQVAIVFSAVSVIYMGDPLLFCMSQSKRSVDSESTDIFSLQVGHYDSPSGWRTINVLLLPPRSGVLLLVLDGLWVKVP